METDLQLLTLTEEMSTAVASDPPSIPLPDVGWQELLDRYATATFEAYSEYWEDAPYSAYRQNGDTLFRLKIRLKKWQDILQPPATVQQIAEATDNLTGLLDDFKQMVAIHNGFSRPEEDFHVGGCAGICADLIETTDSMLEHLLDRRPDRMEWFGQQYLKVYNFEGVDTPNNAGFCGHVIELVPLISDGQAGVQYIIPHETWKKYGDPEAKPGEHRYVQVDLGDQTREWPSFMEIQRRNRENIVMFK